MILPTLRRTSLWHWGLIFIIWGLLVLVYLHLRSTSVWSHENLQLTSVRKPLQPIFFPPDEPLVDKSPQPTEAELIELIAKKCPSLPIEFWQQNKAVQHKMFYKNRTCALYPTIFDLKFDNVYWQTLETTNGTFHIFGAYLDVRDKSDAGPSIRLLVMLNRIAPTVVTYCQIWYNGTLEPVIVQSVQYKYIWIKGWGNWKQNIFEPYLVTCPLLEDNNTEIPVMVSLVEEPCDRATNHLRVIYNRPEKKKRFAVCVKGLDFSNDLSIKLIEWIELLGVLGADKIFFYQLQVHPNVSKVLEHYEARGKVGVTPLTLPGGLPNLPAFRHMYLKKKIIHKRQNELIPYNDCLYKNMYTYDYIVLLDTDEVIMPVQDMDWGSLMDRVLPESIIRQSAPRASYNVRNVYFLDDQLHSHGWFKDIPRYMHMLQHVYRSRNFTRPGYFIKCFHDTQRVLTLHNHFPFSCCCGHCTSYSINTSEAQLQHYRTDCVGDMSKKSCYKFRTESVMDTTVWKYRDVLVARVVDTLRTLGFL